MEERVSNKEKKKFINFSKIKTNFVNDPLSWTIIIGITIFFVIFLIIPLIFVLINAVYYQGAFGFDAIVDVFSSKFFWDPSGSRSDYIIRKVSEPNGTTVFFIRGPDYGVFLNTIVIGVFTTLLSLIIGLITALLMAKVEFRGKTIFAGFLLIPLVLPPFVGGIGFFAIAGPEGILNVYFLEKIFGIKIILEGVVAIVIVQSLHYFTLIYLNVYSSLMNSDPSMEESAENLGANDAQITRNISLPLALPGIASGSVLVLILALEDLGTPIIFAGFGDEIAKKTMTYYIADNLFTSNNSTEIVQSSAVLGGFLLIFAIIGFMIIRKYVSLRQYSMVSKGRAGEFRQIKTSRFQRFLIYGYFITVIIISTLPHIGLLFRSLLSSGSLPNSFSDIWGEFTLNNFATIFLSSEAAGFGNFVKNTMIYSVIATVLIIVLATFAGYVANRKKFYGQSLFDTLVTIPIAIPGVVLGIGYLRMFSEAKTWFYIGDFPVTLNPFTFPPMLLVISYTIRKFPFTVRAVYAGLQQTSEVLEEAAINVGASKPQVLKQIVVPLIALNIIAGSLVSLVYTMSEVSTTLILINEDKYGNIVWKLQDLSGSIGELAAVGAFLMFLQSISLMGTNLLLRNRAEAMTGI